ncbi:MAG: hypothetical protein EOO99_09675 [Pedobacter sp.]|nr:MAG: hypothetical protein EOO99_09675 [Pedobacter sp.]
MKPNPILIMFLLFWVVPSWAQSALKGKVKNSKGEAIASVNLSIKDADGNILSYTRTNEKGEFNISTENLDNPTTIELSIIGFEKKIIPLKEFKSNTEITLNESAINLKEVEIKRKPSIYQKGDTLNYRPSDFSGAEDRSIGDVIKKMPGMEVDDKGKISYNGKNISNLYIDKDNLLDDKYGIATKSLNHLAVDKVQVIENDQPIKMLQDKNMSEDVAINLVLKDDARMKLMGDIKAGVGNPEKYDGNANALMFNKKLKFINNLKGNNIGDDPGLDITSYNASEAQRRLDNDKPGTFLSGGAAGVPNLPQNRTLFNQASLINLNNLYKFKEDLQLRVNAAYLYDNRNQDYFKSTETYLPDQTIRFEELQYNSLTPQKLQTNLLLNANAVQHFLNNSFKINYSPFKANTSTQINGIGAFQEITQKPFELSNEFDFRLKTKSSNIIRLYSYVSYANQPEDLTIKPGINEQIFNNGFPYEGLKQQVDLPNWFTNNSVSYGFSSGKFMHTYRSGISYQEQELQSDLYKINGSLTNAGNDFKNRLNWNKAKIYTDVNLEYGGDSFKTTLNLPLNYVNIHYFDQAKGLDKNLDRFFFNPTFGLRLKVGNGKELTGSYAYRNQLGGLNDVYEGGILRNYRSLFANDAPLSETASQSASLNFNLKKPIQMFFLNGGISYMHNEMNTISSSIITETLQQRIVLPLINQMKSFSTNWGASKYVLPIRSTFSAGYSLSYSEFEQLQNNQLLPYESIGNNYKAGIETKLAKNLSFSHESTWSVNNNRLVNGSNLKTVFKQSRHQSRISYLTMKSLYLQFKSDYIQTIQVNQENINYVFADFSARYRVVKYKTDLEFTLQNIGNIKQFDANILTANAFTQGQYSIPGRIAMLKATFNF